MRYKKIISQKWAHAYQIKEVFFKDKLYQKTLDYINKQKYIDSSKVKELNETFLNKKFPFCNILVFEKRIVGFLGTIFSNKFTFNKKYTNCNVHSWIVDTKHRIFSSLLFNKIMDRNCTITALSPPAKLFETYEKMKFKKFNMYYNLIYIKKLPFLNNVNKFTLLHQDREIKKKLDKKNFRIFKDHSNKKFQRFIFYEKNKKPNSLIIANMTYKKKYLKILNILYVSNKNFLKKNIHSFCDLVSSEFNISLCSEYFIKSKKESVLSSGKIFNYKKKGTIYLKNKPSKLEFNNLYSELEY